MLRNAGRTSASVLILVLLLAACQSDGAVNSSSTSPTTNTNPPAPATTTTETKNVTSTSASVADLGALDTLLRDWTAENDPVGVAAAALYPDGTLWLEAAGLADREAGIPVQASDHFEIGSVTKTFMSVLTLRLVEEGVVALDDPVSMYVPDFPEAADMTIRMLLGHRAGVYDPTAELVSDREGPPDPYVVFTPDELIAASAAGSPTFPPDSRHDYSNANYWVLGAVLETATRTDVGTLLDQFVIEPMGLTATTFFDDTLPDVEVVNAYKDLDLDGIADPMGTNPLPGFVTPAWTAGAIISAASDLVTFLDGVFAGEILSEASVEDLTDRSNGGGGYALGIYASGGYWGHDGAIAGYLAAVFHDPRTGVTVATLTNRFGPDAPQADALAMRLMPAANRVLDG